MADQHCIAAHNYETHKPQPVINHNAHHKIKTAPKLGQRKFAV